MHDGEWKGWYKNGQLNYHYYYEKGKRKGIWKSWYESGQIKYVQPHNKDGHYVGIVVSYYPNGVVRWKERYYNEGGRNGYYHEAWREDGSKELTYTYENGKLIDQVRY